MEDKNHLKTGATEVSLGTPLINMGVMLNPAEFGHRARATDVAMAVNAMLGELAIMKAEVITLRVAVATFAEQTAQLRNEISLANRETLAQVSDAVETMKAMMSELRTERAKLEASIVSAEYGIIARLGDQISQRANASDRAISEIPETYAGARFRAWLKLIFSREY